MTVGNDRESQPPEQAPALAASAAQTVLGAIRTGKQAAGIAAGTAAAGPLGAAIGFAVTRKTFWKLLFSILLSVLLLIMVITNLFGILLAYFGLADADGYVQTAKEREAVLIREQIDMLMEQQPEAFAELFAVLDEKWEVMKREIEEDYQAEYGMLEHYELELTDEYADHLKPEFSRYLSVLFAQSWNGSQIRSFLGTGTADLYRTELTSVYDEYFEQAQEMYGVDSALLKAVAKAESDFNPDARSSAGAMGIMQLMPKTAASLGVSNPYDPKQSILGGAKYLADSFAVFGGYDHCTELVLASYHAGVGAVKRAGYRVPQDGQTPEYVEKVLNYVELAESGSLTPGRQSRQESSDESLQMLLGEVYSREDSLFRWGKEGVREEERKTVHYYQRNGQEISKVDYDSYLSAGETGLLTEERTETWHVVSYRIVNLLNAKLPESKEGYSYKYVTTQKRFLQALEMLKFLADEPDQEAFIRRFGWKELVDGYDAFEVSFSTDVVTEGESLCYETVQGCVREVVYFNQTEEPWASVSFSNTTVKKSGCGPASMAMVISTLTAQDVTPAELAQYTEEHGLYVAGKGTSHSLPALAAKNWGLSVERVRDTQMKKVALSLQDGALAVVICGEYTITGSGSGHYIVLTGVTEEGYFTIADPASRERSGRLYSPDTIRAYARDLDAGSIWIIRN